MKQLKSELDTELKKLSRMQHREEEAGKPAS
jgi:hypothetical protein